MNKIKLFIIFLLLLASVNSFSQDGDSIPSDYKRLLLRPRFGISVQRNVFPEIGLSLHRYQITYPDTSRYSHYGFSMSGFYLSSEIMLRTDKTIIGPKIGAEFAGAGPTSGGAWGLELTCYTDFKTQTYAITPSFGLPIGFCDIHYAFNIFTNRELTHYIGRHCLSISVNLNREYWKKRSGPFRTIR